MATGMRDVKYVIQAKDEATKTLTNVAESFDLLRKEQQGSSDQLSKDSSVIGSFANQVKQLNAALRGGQAAKEFGSAVGQVVSSLSNLDSAIKETNAELDKNKKALQDIEVRQQAATTANDRADQSYKELRRTLSDYNRQVKSANTELDRAGKALETNNTRQTQAGDKITQLTKRYEELKSTFKDLTHEIIQSPDASKNLRESFSKTRAELVRIPKQIEAARNAQTKLTFQQAEHSKRVAEASAKLAKLKSEQEGANRAFESAGDALQKTKQELNLVDAEYKSLANQQWALEKTINRLNTQFDRASNTMKGMASASGTTADAVGDMSHELSAKLSASVSEASVELDKLKAKMEASGRTGTPATTQQITLYNQLRDAVAKASTGFTQLRDAALTLKNEIAAANGDVAKSQQAWDKYKKSVDDIKNSSNASAAQIDSLLTKIRGIGGTTGTASQNMAKTASHTRNYGDAANAATRSTGTLGSAFNQLYGASRKSMSTLQRIRGQILSLTANFIGLHSAIRVYNHSMGTFLDYEAATSRMNVALRGDVQAVGDTMEWLQGQADRLGFSVNTMANEFSKFAIATRGSAIEGQKTRDIFLSVTEAARVFKLSNEQVEGTFLALSQMMNKSVVSMEELRRQMGERIYGAFTIAADGMGITTKELDKLVASGQLASSEFLPKFAAQLRTVVGPQLPEALDTLNKDLGSFRNEIDKAGRTIAAQFTPALSSALRSLTEFLRSEGGKEFTKSIGDAFASVAKAVEFATENIKLLGAALLAIGIRRASAPIKTLNDGILGLAAGFKNSVAQIVANAAATQQLVVSYNATSNAMAAQQRLVTAQTTLWGRFTASLMVNARAMTVSAARAGILSKAIVGVRIAVTALQAVMSLFGGVVGAVLTGVIYLWQRYESSTTKANNKINDAISESSDLISGLQSSWDQARSGFITYAEALKGVDTDDVVRKWKSTVDALQTSIENLPTLPVGLFSAPKAEELAVSQQITRLRRQAIDGQISWREFSSEVRKLGDNLDKPNAKLEKYINAVAESGDKNQTMQRTLGDIARVLEKLGVELDESQLAALRFASALDETVDSPEAAAAKIEEFTRTIASSREQLADYDPDFKSARELTEKLESVDTQYDSIIAMERERLKLLKFTSDEIEEQLKITEAEVGVLRDRAKVFIQMQHDTKAARGSGRDPVKALIKDLDKQLRLERENLRLTTLSGRKRDLEAITVRTMNQYLERSNELGGVGKKQIEEIIELRKQIYSAEEERKAREEAERALEQTIDGIERQIELSKQKLYLQGLEGSERELERITLEMRNSLIREGVLLEGEHLELLEEAIELRKQEWREENKNYDEKQKISKIEEENNEHLRRKKVLLEEISRADETGDVERLEKAQVELAKVNEELLKNYEAIALIQEQMGDTTGLEEVRQKMEEISRESAEVGFQLELSAKSINESIGKGLTDTWGSFLDQIAKGEASFKNLGRAMAQFFLDTVRQIAMVIIQWQILNAVSGGMAGGGAGGAIFGMIGVGTNHKGGMAGRGFMRRVNPIVFAGARKFHTGGLVSGEVPAILKRDEEVLTADDPRHVKNGGASGGNVKVINAFDAGSFMSEALSSNIGEQSFLNYVRANSMTIRSSLGIV